MPTHNPRRGEIWQVDFSPQRSTEIRSPHPAIVVSADSIGRLPLRIVVPITDAVASQSWFVKLLPSQTNGLDKQSVADAFQCKSISLDRFMYYRGVIDEVDLSEVIAAIQLCIGA